MRLNCPNYFLQMLKVKGVSEELQRRFPDSAVEKASKATLQSLLDQHDLLSQDLERELSSLMLLRQYALSLLHDVEVPSPTSEQDELPGLKEIRGVQDQMERSEDKGSSPVCRSDPVLKVHYFCIFPCLCLQSVDTVKKQAGSGSSGVEGQRGSGEGTQRCESLDSGDQRASP